MIPPKMFMNQGDVPLLLLNAKQLAELPDGTAVWTASGKRYVKGIDRLENDDTLSGFMSFGLRPGE